MAPLQLGQMDIYKSNTLCKAEQPLQGLELQEKEAEKDQRMQEISLERTYS